MSKQEWTFEKVLRVCQHNEQLQREGAKRGFLYDFKVLLNGEHVAWWSQYSRNGQIDNRGFRYWLKDKMWEPISNGERYPAEHPVGAHNRGEFESILAANFNRIPADEELARRKSDRQAKEDSRKAERDAREKRERIERAAPQLLEALKNLLALSRPHFSDSTQILALNEAEAAILAAELVTEGERGERKHDNQNF